MTTQQEELDIRNKFINLIQNNKVKQGTWKNIENHKIYMDWLGLQLGYKISEDWYKISQKDIYNNFGGGLLPNYYNGSPLQLLKSVYPKENWLPWKFRTTSMGFWKDKKNHKIYMDWLDRQLGYKTLDDWYKISVKDIINNDGGGLLDRYNGSPLQLLKSVYPEKNWLPWKFTITCNGYWKDKKNHKIYMDWLRLQLGYKTPEDWYKISQKDFINNDGDGLLVSHYNGSPLQILKSVYPEENWLPWKFTLTSMGFWKDRKNHKIYMDWFRLQLGYKNHEDWYNISVKDIRNNDGGGLLQYYNNSPSQLLKSVYPKKNWLPWKFTHTPMGYWDDIENHKIYMDWLGTQLGYKILEDWYKISKKDIINNDGGGLLHYYNCSPSRLVISVYPEKNWLPWKFTPTPMGYWNDIENHKIYMDWLGKELGYKILEDWYNISAKDIINNDGGGLLGRYNNSPKLLVTSIYPNYPWNLSKFQKNYSQGQIEWLNCLIIKKYPDMRHALNHDKGEYSIPNSKYFADGYSKTKNTILEYHGDYYHGNPEFYNLEELNKRTKTTYGELYENTLQKQRFCEDSGYNYISIWESEWFRFKNSIILLQRLFKDKRSFFK